MKHSKVMIAALGLAGAALAFPAAAQMRAPSLSSAYLGLGLGQGEQKFDCGGASCDKKDTSFRLFAGYQFHPNVAAELGWVDFGKAKIDEGIFGQGSVKFSAFDLSALGMFPLANQFSIYGRLGLWHGETKLDDAFGSAKSTKTGLLWGVGGQFDLNRNIGFRAEWSQYRKAGGGDFTETWNNNLLNIQALYRFQ